MNKAEYRHLLHTYGRRPAVWFGLFAELVRTGIQRVWVAIIVAQIATDLASNHLESAKQNAMLFLIVYVAAAVIGAIGDLVAINSENNEYRALTMSYYRKLIGKDMSFYRDHQTGYLVSLFRQYLDSMMLLSRLLRSDVARMAVSFVAPVIVLMVADLQLGLVACGIVAVQVFYVMWSSSKANRYRKISDEVYRRFTGEVSDHITNIVAFKAGGVERRAAGKVAELAREETTAFWLRRKITVLLDLPRELVTAAGVTLAFLVVLGAASGNPASIGLVMLTLTYVSDRSECQRVAYSDDTARRFNHQTRSDAAISRQRT